MAGSVRKRTWTTSKGERKTAWQLDYFDQNRKRHTEQYRTRREADAELLKIRGEVADGTHVPKGDSMTVAAAADFWLNRREAINLRSSSLRTYRGYIKQIVKRIGAVKLALLSESRIDEFADNLVRELGAKRGKAVLNGLKMILEAARAKKRVAYNAAAPVKIVAPKKAPIAVGVDVPTKTEVAAIIAAATGPNRPRLITLLFSGMRTEELRALTWEDIDLARGMVRIRQAAQQNGTIGPTKSAAGYREIPLPPIAINTLRKWKLKSRPGSVLVFPGRGTAPLDHGGIQQGFGRVQRAAGVVDEKGEAKYSLHALRHFYASWHIERGTQPKRLQQLMGHASIRMTYDTYGHWLGAGEDEHEKLAIDAAALLAGS
jgi:integrase